MTEFDRGWICACMLMMIIVVVYIIISVIVAKISARKQLTDDEIYMLKTMAKSEEEKELIGAMKYFKIVNK